MDYLKSLLHKEKIALNPQTQLLTECFEMIGNQQEFKNVIKKVFGLLQGLEGDVSLLQFQHTKFKTLGFLGNRENVDVFLEDKTLLWKLRDTKKPYFAEFEKEPFENYFIALPITSKDEFLGALCIHTPQENIDWASIHTFMYIMVIILRFYHLVEINKDIDIKDVVTGLFNHRHFNDQLDLEKEKAERYHIPLTLLMIDISNFRAINEKLGYDAGDDVLVQVGKYIQSTCRLVDMPARLDKDTFAVLLSNTPGEGGHALLERINMKINNNTIKTQGKEFKIRIRSSVVPYEKGMSNEEFIASANKQIRQK